MTLQACYNKVTIFHSNHKSFTVCGKLYQTPFSAGTLIHYNIATTCIRLLIHCMYADENLDPSHVAPMAHA